MVATGADVAGFLCIRYCGRHGMELVHLLSALQ
jgi:hypothetical protein